MELVVMVAGCPGVADTLRPRPAADAPRSAVLTVGLEEFARWAAACPVQRRPLRHGTAGKRAVDKITICACAAGDGMRHPALGDGVILELGILWRALRAC